MTIVEIAWQCSQTTMIMSYKVLFAYRYELSLPKQSRPQIRLLSQGTT